LSEVKIGLKSIISELHLAVRRFVAVDSQT